MAAPVRSQGSEAGGITWKAIAAILAGMVAWTTIHAYWVMPVILKQAAEEARIISRDHLDAHRETVHRDSMTRSESRQMADALTAKMDTVLVEIRNVKERLDRLEKRIDGK